MGCGDELAGEERGKEVVAGVGEDFAVTVIGIRGLGGCCHGGRLSM